MRGSPLLRTFVVLALLALAGLALARLTRPASRPLSPPPVTEEDAAESPALEAAYRLALSAEAETIELESAGATRQTPEGRLRIDESNPVIFLKIDWKEAPASHRFAKLSLDIPGKATLSHVFEAPGDIDDVWEIDLP